jgi:polysaccharide export outer membrane protein
MNRRGISLQAVSGLLVTYLAMFALGHICRAQGADGYPRDEKEVASTPLVDIAAPVAGVESIGTTGGVSFSATRSTIAQNAGLPAYRIGVDDVLTITVWHEPDISRNVPVRPDGKISLPLVGEVQAAGTTTPELEKQLRASLAKFIKDPEVTVMVAEIRSQRVNVIGQVMRPGAFALTQSMGVLDAIALAGGLRDFAKKGSIYVLRASTNGNRVRIPYDYKAVLKGKHDAQEILLRANDTVVVP